MSKIEHTNFYLKGDLQTCKRNINDILNKIDKNTRLMKKADKVLYSIMLITPIIMFLCIISKNHHYSIFTIAAFFFMGSVILWMDLRGAICRVFMNDGYGDSYYTYKRFFDNNSFEECRLIFDKERYTEDDLTFIRDIAEAVYVATRDNDKREYIQNYSNFCFLQTHKKQILSCLCLKTYNDIRFSYADQNGIVKEILITYKKCEESVLEKNTCLIFDAETGLCTYIKPYHKD